MVFGVAIVLLTDDNFGISAVFAAAVYVLLLLLQPLIMMLVWHIRLFQLWRVRCW